MALSVAQYLADKSALARMHQRGVADRLGPLLEECLVATCAIVDLEILYSARSLRDYEDTLEERRSFEDVAITAAMMGRAIDIQHELARRGQHRLPIPDLIIAATAESSRLTVLHYDADFELIAAVIDLSHEWVVPRGSV